MKFTLPALKDLLRDIASLREPALAASVVGTLVAVVSPFGVNVGSSGPILIAAVTVLGLLVELGWRVAEHKSAAEIVRSVAATAVEAADVLHKAAPASKPLAAVDKAVGAAAPVVEKLDAVKEPPKAA